QRDEGVPPAEPVGDAAQPVGRVPPRVYAADKAGNVARRSAAVFEEPPRSGGLHYTATKLPWTRLPLSVSTEPCHLALSLRCSSPAPAAFTGFHASDPRLASAASTSSGVTV